MSTIAAYGRCDDLVVELLRPEAGETWELQVSASGVDFRFAVRGPETLSDMVRFTESVKTEYEELEVGAVFGRIVVLAGEGPSGAARFWLKVRGDDGFFALWFGDEQARRLAAAIRNARDELQPYEQPG